MRPANAFARSIWEEWGGSLGTKVQRRSRYDRYNAKAKKDYLVDSPSWRRSAGGSTRRSSAIGRTTDGSCGHFASEFCTIQVRGPVGADVSLPWSLVYDIPIELGAPEKLKLCPWLHATALVGRTTEEMLSKQLADDVPDVSGAEQARAKHPGPFGFWGIHHVIELPPSVPSGSRLATELVHAIPFAWCSA